MFLTTTPLSPASRKLLRANEILTYILVSMLHVCYSLKDSGSQQLGGAGSLLPYVASGDQIQVIRLDGIFNLLCQSLGCLRFYIVERQAG